MPLRQSLHHRSVHYAIQQRYRALNKSQRTAVWVSIGAVVYLIFASLFFSGSPGDEPQISLTSNKDISKLIQIEKKSATPKTLSVVLYGQTEANRVVKLKAQSEGQVLKINIPEGSHVMPYDVIMEIEARDRSASLEKAKSLVAQRRIQYEAARRLRKTGAQTEVRAAEALAQYEEAKATLSAAQIQLDHITIRSPFEGRVENISAEVGSLVGRGFDINGEDTVATIIEYNPIVVTGSVPQDKRSQLQPDAPAKIHLMDGTETEGKIRFIGMVTDTETRTFRVEVEVPNPDGKIPVGVSAELHLAAGQFNAYLVSPSLLALDNDGTIGIKLVDDQDIARFYPVQLLEDNDKGIWIGGLPEKIRLITWGQNYVSPGQYVGAPKAAADAGE